MCLSVASSPGQRQQVPQGGNLATTALGRALPTVGLCGTCRGGACSPRPRPRCCWSADGRLPPLATVILRPGYRYGEHTRRCGRCQPVADDADVPGRRYLRRDHRTRAQAGRRAGERLDRLLTEFEVPHDVKIYPGAGHGFMNDHNPADATLLLRFLARISGTKSHQVQRGGFRRPGRSRAARRSR